MYKISSFFYLPIYSWHFNSISCVPKSSYNTLLWKSFTFTSMFTNTDSALKQTQSSSKICKLLNLYNRRFYVLAQFLHFLYKYPHVHHIWHAPFKNKDVNLYKRHKEWGFLFLMKKYKNLRKTSINCVFLFWINLHYHTLHN